MEGRRAKTGEEWRRSRPTGRWDTTATQTVTGDSTSRTKSDRRRPKAESREEGGRDKRREDKEKRRRQNERRRAEQERAQSLARGIEDQPYYHGYLNRETCEPMLVHAGDFLVRKKADEDDKFVRHNELYSRSLADPLYGEADVLQVLSIRTKKGRAVHHVMGRNRRSMWSLGGGEEETVPLLVDYLWRSQKGLQLQSTNNHGAQSPICLVRPVNKEQWEILHRYSCRRTRSTSALFSACTSLQSGEVGLYHRPGSLWRSMEGKAHLPRRRQQKQSCADGRTRSGRQGRLRQQTQQEDHRRSRPAQFSLTLSPSNDADEAVTFRSTRKQESCRSSTTATSSTSTAWRRSASP